MRRSQAILRGAAWNRIRPRPATPVPPPNHLKRLAWLVACFSAGLTIALTGESLTDHQAWYLAIPAILTAGWLFLADPTKCDPPARKPPQAANQDPM